MTPPTDSSNDSPNHDRGPLVDFDDVLEGRVPNGVVEYLGTEAVDDLASRSGSVGWKLIAIDGRAIGTKPEFLRAWSEGAEFPDTFGHNWDALADSLTDLSWLHAPGYVVLIDDCPADGALGSTADTSVGWEIVAEACDSWAANGTPFVVLRRGLASGR